MSEIQKIIKYFAIAFAFLLVFSIISGVAIGIFSLSNITSSHNNSNNINNLDINSYSSVLDIDIKSSNVIIKQGEKLLAETNNQYITVKQNQNKLSIMESKNNWLNHDAGELIIYVPTDFIFDEVSIESGAGKIEINQLYTKKLELELGAGKVTIDNLIVLSNANIDGGAGDISITNANINNAKIELGVGKLLLTSQLSGFNKIESGIGKADLQLLGTMEDYKIMIEKGLGVVNIDGSNMKNNSYYGNGSDVINIESGIGNVNINFLGR